MDEPSNSKDGDELTWELRYHNGTTVRGSQKLWVRAFPQVKQKKVNEQVKPRFTTTSRAITSIK